MKYFSNLNLIPHLHLYHLKIIGLFLYFEGIKGSEKRVPFYLFFLNSYTIIFYFIRFIEVNFKVLFKLPLKFLSN